MKFGFLWPSLIFAFWGIAARAQSPFDPQTSRRLVEQRQQLWQEVEAFDLPGWKTKGEQKPSDVLYRDQEYRDAVDKYLNEARLTRDKGSSRIADQLLATPDPVASFIAYRHLVRWASKSKDPDRDRDFQRDSVRVVLSTQPHPIEYSLLFAQVYDFAKDQNTGKGLSSQEALGYAIEHFRDPDAFTKLIAHRSDEIFDREKTRLETEEGYQPAQKEFYAAREVLRNRDEHWQSKISNDITKLRVPANVDEFKTTLRGNRTLRPNSTALIDRIAELPEPRRSSAGAHLLNFLDFRINEMGNDAGAANEEAQTIFGRNPGNISTSHQAYRRAFGYATNSEFGLGLSDEDAHQFALAFATKSNGVDALETFQRSLIERQLAATTPKETRNALLQTAHDAGLDDNLVQALTLMPLKNRWVKNPEPEKPKLAQGPGDNESARPSFDWLKQSQKLAGPATAALLGVAAGIAVKRVLNRRSCEANAIQLIHPEPEAPLRRPRSMADFDRFLDDAVRDLGLDNPPAKPTESSPFDRLNRTSDDNAMPSVFRER
jgi:hypothetical protein